MAAWLLGYTSSTLGSVRWLRTCSDRPNGSAATSRSKSAQGGATFAQRFEARAGRIPDYPAAQAAATGWLAAEATRRGLGADEVHHWRTTTLLGDFALDPSWRQVGYTPVVVQGHRGRLDPL